MGRPSVLTEEQADQALRYTIQLGNAAAAKYMNVSRSTIERLRRKVGLSQPGFLEALIVDVRQLGIERSAERRQISVGLIEDILRRYPEWASNRGVEVAEIIEIDTRLKK